MTGALGPRHQTDPNSRSSTPVPWTTRDSDGFPTGGRTGRAGASRGRERQGRRGRTVHTSTSGDETLHLRGTERGTAGGFLSPLVEHAPVAWESLEAGRAVLADGANIIDTGGAFVQVTVTTTVIGKGCHGRDGDGHHETHKRSRAETHPGGDGSGQACNQKSRPGSPVPDASQPPIDLPRDRVNARFPKRSRCTTSSTGRRVVGP